MLSLIFDPCSPDMFSVLFRIVIALLLEERERERERESES